MAARERSIVCASWGVHVEELDRYPVRPPVDRGAGARIVVCVRAGAGDRGRRAYIARGPRALRLDQAEARRRAAATKRPGGSRMGVELARRGARYFREGLPQPLGRPG